MAGVRLMMMPLLLVACPSCLLGQVQQGQAVLVDRGDFESSGTDGWSCSGCTIKTSSRASYGSGERSLLVTNRKANTDGPSYSLTLDGDGLYDFIAYLKVKSLAPNQLYETVEMFATCKNAADTPYDVTIGNTPLVYGATWHQLGATARLPSVATDCSISFRSEYKETDYYLDNVSVQKVPEVSANWQLEAEASIIQNRKAELTLSIAKTWGPGNIKVQLIPKSEHFNWGVRVEPILLDHSNPASAGYKAFIIDHFKTADLSAALIWTETEPSEGAIAFSRANDIINQLLPAEMEFRGGSLISSAIAEIPNWVQGLQGSGGDIHAAIGSRINSVIDEFGQRIKRWVLNEQFLSTRFFEEFTDNVQITRDIFVNVSSRSQIDKVLVSSGKVLIEDGMFSAALLNQAKRLLRSGIDKLAVDIKSDFSEAIDVAAVQRRLSTVGEAGIDVEISDLFVAMQNEQERASELEKILTILFKDPRVTGINLANIMVMPNAPQSALIAGDATPNAAGYKFLELRDKWSPKEESRTMSKGDTQPISLFKGVYELRVSKGNEVVHQRDIDLFADTAVTLYPMAK